ncbi:hypothetical protein [Polyangium aurulentum]|uniref:hypothetical protein n=1 Tax=Polyangium aurulentum TaxID=2567896 RepID=UPI0010AE433D|nr:hypothetical protein [Polyangium aurulentum]UQA56968.1 hypothetical protein E8A73_037605 [Polyangium aurulentum]
MTDTPVQPRASLADYTPAEVEAIVAIRCKELSEHLGWEITPPAVKIVSPDALSEAMEADQKARSEKIRGAARDVGLLASMAGWLLRLISPSMLGYFGTHHNTLYLNGEVVPQQAAYVLLHELVHAAQWQRFPELFERLDAGRVAAEDLADRHGDDAEATRIARDHYESLVTFIEGHATLHGRRVCEARLLRDAPTLSADEVRAYVNALTGLDPSDETMAQIYLRGESTLANLDPLQVDAIFREPDQIVRLFSRLSS